MMMMMMMMTVTMMVYNNTEKARKLILKYQITFSNFCKGGGGIQDM